jgi:multidrug efflux pump subunit AcrA (membrane-fusion protein)
MRLILFKSLSVSFAFVLFSCANKQSETHPVRKDLIESVYASVTILPKDVYKVNASISGYLDQLNVAEGDAIKKGQLLFVISNEVMKLNERNAELNYEWVKDNFKGEANVLEDLKLSIYSAKVKQINDSLNAERMKVLFSQNACSKFEMENAVTVSEFSTNTLLSLTNQLKRKQQELTNQLGQAHNNASASALRSGDYLIKSNQDGKVYQINKEQGELVSMQEPLAIIGKKDQFIVSMMVDEVDVGQIDLGQTVWVTLEAFPGKPFEAKKLLKKSIYLPEEELADLDDNQFYNHEISGYQVVDTIKGDIGIVDTVIDLVSNPLLRLEKDSKEVLIPIFEGLIQKVDRKKKILYIQAPEGLIDLYLG